MDERKSVDWFWGYIEGYARASKLMFARKEEYEIKTVKLTFTDSFTDRKLDVLVNVDDFYGRKDFGYLAHDVIRKVSYEFCMR